MLELGNKNAAVSFLQTPVPVESESILFKQ